jgi:hypothetical protein
VSSHDAEPASSFGLGPCRRTHRCPNARHAQTAARRYRILRGPSKVLKIVYRAVGQSISPRGFHDLRRGIKIQVYVSIPPTLASLLELAWIARKRSALASLAISVRCSKPIKLSGHSGPEPGLGPSWTRRGHWKRARERMQNPSRKDQILTAGPLTEMYTPVARISSRPESPARSSSRR